MNIHRTFVAVVAAQLVFVLGGSAMAAPRGHRQRHHHQFRPEGLGEGDPLKGGGTFKYGKDNYVITITKGYISPNGNAAHLTGTVPVNGKSVPCSLVCDRTTGYLKITFGSVKFWSKGNVSITK